MRNTIKIRVKTIRSEFLLFNIRTLEYCYNVFCPDYDRRSSRGINNTFVIRQSPKNTTAESQCQVIGV